MSPPRNRSSSPQLQTLPFSSNRPPKAPLHSPITERFLRSHLNLAEGSYRGLTAICEAALSAKSQLLERHMRTPEDREWYASELSAACLFPPSLVRELSAVVPDDTMRAWLLYCVGSRRRTAALAKRRKEIRNTEVHQERSEGDGWRNALLREQQEQGKIIEELQSKVSRLENFRGLQENTNEGFCRVLRSHQKDLIGLEKKMGWKLR